MIRAIKLGLCGLIEVTFIGFGCVVAQATGKRKAALRMGKMSVGRSMSVGFVPSSSANLKLSGDT